MNRTRRSAKDVIATYADELLRRSTDPHIDHKLATVEQIAFRMGWNDLYNKLRYRKAQPREERWWEK